MPSKNLRTLNNGWPFTDAPLECPVLFETRRGECPTAVDGVCQCENPLSCITQLRRRSLYMRCGQVECPQAIIALDEPGDVAVDPENPAPAVWTLATLKARVVDHWLKVHPDEIAEMTYC